MGRNLWSMGQQALDQCPSCGAQTRPGEHFCVNCGNRLLSATPPERENDMRDQPPRKGMQAMERKLRGIGGTCLAIMALFLGVSALLGLLAVLIQIGSPWTGWLIILAGVIGLGIVHYQRGTLLPFLIVVVLLPLLGILGVDKKIGGAWSVMLVLLLLGVSYAIASLSPRRRRRAFPSSTPQEQRWQQAIHYVGEHGVITNTAYCELTGVPEEVARHDLEELVKRGALRATGNPQGGYYRFS